MQDQRTAHERLGMTVYIDCKASVAKSFYCGLVATLLVLYHWLNKQCQVYDGLRFV